MSSSRRKLIPLLLLALATALVAAACGSGDKQGTVPAGAIALVGERAIPKADLDRLLEQLETTPGPTAESAIEAVALLAEVYGEALARTADLLSSAPELLETLTSDELLGHLCTLHGINLASPEHRLG